VLVTLFFIEMKVADPSGSKKKGKCLKKNPIIVEKDLETGDSESGVEPDDKIFTVYASEEEESDKDESEKEKSERRVRKKNKKKKTQNGHEGQVVAVRNFGWSHKVERVISVLKYLIVLLLVSLINIIILDIEQSWKAQRGPKSPCYPR